MNIPEQDIEIIANNLRRYNSCFAGKTILLCGGSGFLGNILKSYFIYLNKRDYPYNKCRIISVDNYIVGTCPKDIDGDGVTNINHNLVLPIDQVIGYDCKIDYIINCSGLASPAGYEKFPLETLDISYTGTKLLLELAARKGAVYLAFSSSEIYGTPPDHLVPTPETYWGSFDGFGKRSPYDSGKKIIESLCWTFNNKYGVNTKIVRLFNCFGFMAQNDYRVLPNFISSVLKNNKIKIYGDGLQTRTFCFFTDTITGVLLALLEGGNSPYNIGNSDNEISMLNLGKLVEKIAGKTDLVQLIDVPSAYVNEPRRRCPDITKAKDELGYNPKVSLEEGITKFYNWAKDNYKY